VEGELADGRTSDIDFQAIRRRLLASGPLIVLSNFSRLSSREMTRVAGPPKPIHVTERELFEREIVHVKSEDPKLRGEQGVALAVSLLRTLKEGRRENENKGEFEDRASKAGLGVLGLKEET
jgi:hypothetical protein